MERVSRITYQTLLTINMRVHSKDETLAPLAPLLVRIGRSETFLEIFKLCTVLPVECCYSYRSGRWLTTV